MTLRMIDTFSGIGGFSLAARWLGGFQTVQFVEWNPYCQQILAHQFPDIPIHDDISTFNPQPGTADVVCGGFPCQDISIAGKQAGIKEGTRSGLYHQLMRVVRVVRPRYVVLENVAAITSNGMGVVLGELAAAGFDAEWACIPAADLGACHKRDRWWLVAYANDDHLQAGSRQLRREGSAIAGGSSELAYANNERQQEHHAASVADRAGRARWRHAAQCLNPDWRSYMSEPVLPRGDDGLSNRVDRIHALGNAVVPQVAMIPLRRVLDLHHGQS